MLDPGSWIDLFRMLPVGGVHACLSLLIMGYELSRLPRNSSQQKKQVSKQLFVAS
jgi:hypothetical protein